MPIRINIIFSIHSSRYYLDHTTLPTTDDMSFWSSIGLHKLKQHEMDIVLSGTTADIFKRESYSGESADTLHLSHIYMNAFVRIDLSSRDHTKDREWKAHNARSLYSL